MSNVFFYEPSHNFDRLFEHALRPLINVAEAAPEFDCHTVNQRAFKPRMDLHEDSEKNLISATFELPGIKKDDVHLEIRDSLLTVSGEIKSSTEHEKSGYAIRERRFGKFSRSLRLPKGIKDEDIKAALADGVLTVTFPKSSPEQEPKKIIVA